MQLQIWKSKFAFHSLEPSRERCTEVDTPFTTLLCIPRS